MQKQLKLFQNKSTEFGGSLLRNSRHERRSLSIKCPIHLVLKTNTATCGNLRKYKSTIENEIKKWSQKFGVQSYSHSIQLDHIHFNIRISSIENYKRFIRALTGRLAQLIQIKFLYRPFTKLIRFGTQLKNLINYIIQNEEEATGRRPYKQRKYNKPREIKNPKETKD